MNFKLGDIVDITHPDSVNIGVRCCIVGLGEAAFTNIVMVECIGDIQLRIVNGTYTKRCAIYADWLTPVTLPDAPDNVISMAGWCRDKNDCERAAEACAQLNKTILIPQSIAAIEQQNAENKKRIERERAERIKRLQWDTGCDKHRW